MTMAMGLVAGVAGLEPLAHVYRLLDVPERGVEAAGNPISSPHVQRDRRVTERAKLCLESDHRRAAKSITPLVRVDRDVVQPCLAASDSEEDRADTPSVRLDRPDPCSRCGKPV